MDASLSHTSRGETQLSAIRRAQPHRAQLAQPRVEDGPAAQMKLNFDCIFVVMLHLPFRSDVLSLALTCRAMHAYAIEFLRFWSIHIDEACADSVRIDLYVNFPSRFHLIRQISLRPTFDRALSSWADSPRTVELAVEVLQHALYLESLDMQSVDHFGPGCKERLIATCKDTTSLVSLHIAHANSNDLAMVDRMDAPLSALILEISRRVTFTSPYMVFPDLGRFSSTLEVLKLRMDTGVFRIPSLPCTKVHTLHLERVYGVPLSALMTFFPNVRNLTILMRHEGFAVGTLHACDGLAQGTQSSYEDTTWPLLQTVTGDIPSLYTLNLPNRLRRVDISHPAFQSPEKSSYKRLLEYLSRSQPSTLKITLEPRDISWISSILNIVERYDGLSNISVDLTCMTYLLREDAPFVSHLIFCDNSNLLMKAPRKFFDLSVVSFHAPHIS